MFSLEKGNIENNIVIPTKGIGGESLSWCTCLSITKKCNFVVQTLVTLNIAHFLSLTEQEDVTYVTSFLAG